MRAVAFCCVVAFPLVACAPTGYGYGEWNAADPGDAFRLRSLQDCPPPMTVPECQNEERIQAAQKQAAAQLAIQRQAAIKQAADADLAAGYTPTTVGNFLLDGQDLASHSAKISITGAYLHEGNADLLYANSTAVILQTHYQNEPSVALLTTDASRSFRAKLLACQQSVANSEAGCPVTILGTAAICSEENVFGAQRQSPCIDVTDG